MTCIHMMGAIVCVSPWGRLKLGNRYVLVDFHEYCGPSFSWVKGGKLYDPVDENDPIWPLFEAWHNKYEAAKARRDRVRAMAGKKAAKAQTGQVPRVRGHDEPNGSTPCK